MRRIFKLVLISLATIASVIVLAFLLFQRRLLFFPTHDGQSPSSVAAGFKQWVVNGSVIGYVREVPNPRRIWFHTHGNGGQAANRDFILPALNASDSVYVLEYPGYGDRDGTPSMASINNATIEAFDALVKEVGVEKLVVLGESLGTGPASTLATRPHPPKHIVLVVPFDVLTSVASDRFPFLPTKLIMLDQWNNIESLKSFSGKLEIYGAKFDQVIPVKHARNLAKSLPNAVYHEFEGDHGWTRGGLVDLSRVE